MNKGWLLVALQFILLNLTSIHIDRIQVLNYEPDTESILRSILLDQGNHRDSQASMTGAGGSTAAGGLLRNHMYRALDDHPHSAGDDDMWGGEGWVNDGSPLSSSRPRGPGGFTPEAVVLLQVGVGKVWARGGAVNRNDPSA